MPRFIVQRLLQRNRMLFSSVGYHTCLGIRRSVVQIPTRDKNVGVLFIFIALDENLQFHPFMIAEMDVVCVLEQ